MSFAGTYHEEVLASRRDRSRRAFFWAKVTSILLMLTIAVTLRVEPDLRRLILTAGTDAIMRGAGANETSDVADLPGRQVAAPSAQGSSLPRSRIKVNRPAPSPQSDTGFGSPVDIRQLSSQLQQMQLNP